MKDYANFLEEEVRQDRLQKELEYKRFEEEREAEANWRDYQEDQKAKEYEEKYYEDLFDGWPELDYEDDDYYYPDYDPYDLLDVDVPCEPDNFLTAEDLYDMYVDSCEDECCCELENDDPYEKELALGVSEFDEYAVEEERICRKSTSRNRHHASEKAKKRAKKSAEVLETRFWKLYSDLTSHKEANYFRLHFVERDAFIDGGYLSYNKMRRLYYAEKAATKKANRVKVKTA